MKAHIYINNSPNNAMDKNLTNHYEVDIVVRDVVNISRPQIELTGNGFNFNYLWIPAFNRYYFVESSVSVRNNVTRYNLSCDVLMSFKEQIRQSQGIVERQQVQGINELLIDGSMAVRSDRQVDVLKWRESFSKNPQYILVTAGG